MDLNREKSKWVDGRFVMLDEGRKVTLYIGHVTDEISVENPEDPENPATGQRVMAFPIRVAKPLTRAKAINAAEMTAYDLHSLLEVASFGTSLGRKFRDNPEDEEVKEHDNFIKWVKKELDAIGVTR